MEWPLGVPRTMLVVQFADEPILCQWASNLHTAFAADMGYWDHGFKAAPCLAQLVQLALRHQLPLATRDVLRTELSDACLRVRHEVNEPLQWC